MPIYIYKGMDSNGKNVTGIIDAENEKAGRLKLRRTGVFTTDMRLEGEKAGFSLSGDVNLSFMNGVKTEDLAQMTRQLSTLVEANIPLVDALQALQEQIEKPVLKKAISQIKEKVVEGRRLADAMKAFPDIFNDLYISMIQAGEASGALDTVLNRLADFTEYQAALKSKVTGAMTYPIVMATVGISIMLYLLASVVPKIVKVFEKSKMVLPLPTKILITLSEFAQNYWYLVILAIAGLAYLFKRYKKSPTGRAKLDSWMLKAPIFGQMFRKIAISRFSRTLATLMQSGVQLLPALDIVKFVVNNKVLSQAIETTKNSVKEGESIAEPLKKSGQFPPMVIHMIMVGEKTGELEKMLERVANSYDTEVEATVSKMTTLMEPLMLLVMGGMVGFIVLSILIPIFKMSSMQ